MTIIAAVTVFCAKVTHRFSNFFRGFLSELNAWVVTATFGTLVVVGQIMKFCFLSCSVICWTVSWLNLSIARRGFARLSRVRWDNSTVISI